MEATTLKEGTDIHELLTRRRSGRAFDERRPLADADVQALLEAARWAPSGGNVQPWRYVIGRKGDTNYDQLLALLMEGNRQWAQHAPALILTVYQAARVASDGSLQNNRTAMHDLGMANFSLAVEALNRGLMTHMVGGFNRDAALKLIDAEQNHFDVGPMIAVGYETTPAHLIEKLQQMESAPRTRKPVDALLLHL